MRKELRRLRAEVLGLQEEKQDLERRNTHLVRELEQNAEEDPAGDVDVVERDAAPLSSPRSRPLSFRTRFPRAAFV